MKISEFTYRGPDAEDQTLSFECKATVENDSDFPVEMIKTSACLVNSDGVCVGGSSDDEIDTFIDPKESSEIDISTGWNTNSAGFNNELNKIKVISDIVMYRREFSKLGLIDVPKKDLTCEFVSKQSTIAGLVEILGATCFRDKPNDDGDVGVELFCGVRNISNIYIEKVSIKMILIDQEDAQIEDTEQNDTLPPRVAKVINPSLYGVKPGKLRNSSLRITASIYLPVAHFSAEAVAVKEK